MIKVKAKNQEFSLESSADETLLNGKKFDWDFSKISEGKFHIIRNHKSYRAELVEADYEAKTFKIKVNEQIFDLEAKDRFDLLLEKMGMANATVQKINELKAPMPGLVLQIIAKQGEEVKKGDKLLILEAMKMENILKSPSDGIIKSIKAEEGKNVEKNQVLVIFE
ncbi:MAG: biotin carboxyl carrier protein [Flammeovirgaceae bacterium]|jgi:biotin carboxyl carrier protein